MANRVWKSVYLWFFGRSHQLLQTKFFDPSTPCLRKGDDGGEKTGKTGGGGKGENSGHLRHCQLTARTPTDWIVDRSCQNKTKDRLKLKVLLSLKVKAYVIYLKNQYFDNQPQVTVSQTCTPSTSSM